ncbi:hypothetical protein KSP39_PZI011424 [Platanthera zijinensis]|uniref:OTU1-like C-terminal C2H2-type zinc finger domain-containing protein n=1 Tax=Platanthera zijinensis TaxID=2320716 RepID=A0AAP0G637_9ASPA
MVALLQKQILGGSALAETNVVSWKPYGTIALEGEWSEFLSGGSAYVCFPNVFPPLMYDVYWDNWFLVNEKLCCHMALNKLIKLMHVRKRSYTKTANFTLRCGVCPIGVIGQKCAGMPESCEMKVTAQYARVSPGAGARSPSKSLIFQFRKCEEFLTYLKFVLIVASNNESSRESGVRHRNPQ